MVLIEGRGVLRRLADAGGGLYHLTTEQIEAISVRRFADSLATWLGAPAGALGFGDWEAALSSAFGRGRGALELRMKPFDFRAARAYWGIENTGAAFVHNALIGGTPRLPRPRH